MISTADLKLEAERFRRLAGLIGDAETRARLLRMAADFDRWSAVPASRDVAPLPIPPAAEPSLDTLPGSAPSPVE